MGHPLLAHRNKNALLWGFSAVALAGMLGVSVVPLFTLPSVFSTGWDKGQHMAAFAVLAAFGFALAPKRLWLVSVGLLLWGGVIELAQFATGWRYGDWADWFADALGVGLVLAVVWGARRAKAVFNRYLNPHAP